MCCVRSPRLDPSPTLTEILTPPHQSLQEKPRIVLGPGRPSHRLNSRTDNSVRTISEYHKMLDPLLDQNGSSSSYCQNLHLKRVWVPLHSQNPLSHPFKKTQVERRDQNGYPTNLRRVVQATGCYTFHQGR